MEPLIPALDGAMQWLPRAAAALSILAVFWLLEKLARRALTRFRGRRLINDQVFTLLTGATEGGLLIVGVLVALGVLGVNVSAILAGLGLAGFAVGFALRDMISNIVAGVMLLVYRPFVEGDYVLVSGVQGTVETITLRYTRLAAEDANARVLIPNASLFTNPLVVYSGGKKS